MNRRERRVSGRKSTNSSISPAGSTADALHEAGFCHMRAGRYVEAQVSCHRALAIDCNHADTQHLMGLLSAQAQDYSRAVEWIARAIRQNPKPEYLSSLGTTLQRQGRLEEAFQVFDKAVQLRPDDTAEWINLGKILEELNRPTEALLSFQHALKLNPRYWETAIRCAILLQRLERLEEALSYFDLCNNLNPDHSLILQARGLCLRGLKRYEDYLADSRRSHALDPANVDTQNNIGDAFKLLGRHEEALPWFDLALAVRPEFTLALMGKAFALIQVHRFKEAGAIYLDLKKMGLEDVESEWNLAYVSMLTGNFEDGWREREARWNSMVRSTIYPYFSEPMWLGEQSIEGKTVLVHVDEGLGDTIQFARYLPILAARGARVVVVVPDVLVPLFSGLPGVSQCVALSSGRLPAFDFHCPICSLPLAFKTRLDTIPPPISYLPPALESRVQVWEHRLGPRNRLRAGLVWSGNPKHGNDHNRSIALRTLSRILDLDATFVSLQKDPRSDDKAVLLERTDIVDLTAGLTDFLETAALVSCLDLVISVDTSVAHLAAALGRPTWILLPYTPDYRWLLDREDSPWYPTVRLFRQTETRDYLSVLDRVRGVLSTLISASSAVKQDAPATGAVAGVVT
jgi:tetratricopeptide (TPR) repeat protein